jgi:hypothetical protein
MPFMLLQKKGEPLEHDWQWSGDATRLDDGIIIRRWSKSRFDLVTQFENHEDCYV